MTLLEWLPLALVCFLGAATPGPSLALITSQIMRHGAMTGSLASISHAVGVGIYAVGAILGLNALFVQFPAIASAMVILGAAYLVYLGIKLLRYIPQATDAQPSDQETRSATHYKAVLDAFLIAFLNPKLAVFFIALFSQFIPHDGTSIYLGVILVSTVLTIDMLWYLLVVQLITVVQKKAKFQISQSPWFTRIQGIIFILIAVNAVLFSS